MSDTINYYKHNSLSVYMDKSLYDDFHKNGGRFEHVDRDLVRMRCHCLGLVSEPCGFGLGLHKSLAGPPEDAWEDDGLFD